MAQIIAGVLPTGMKLTAKVLKNGRVRFRYVEVFPAQEKKVVDFTYKTARAAVKASLGITLFRTSGGIGVSGTVSRSMFGNMMIGEFLCWGTLGEMKLRDLLVGAAMGGMQAGKQAQAECTGDACEIKRALR